MSVMAQPIRRRVTRRSRQMFHVSIDTHRKEGKLNNLYFNNFINCLMVHFSRFPPPAISVLCVIFLI